MSKWLPSAPQQITQEEEVKLRSQIVVSDIKEKAGRIKTILNSDGAFSEKFDTLYALLADIQYIVNTYGLTEIKKQPALASAYRDFTKYVEEYEAFLEYLNEKSSVADNIALAVTGLAIESEEEIEE